MTAPWNRLNLVGQRFGRLEVLEEGPRGRDGRVRWRCRCSCERRQIVDVLPAHLRRGDTRSCGCLIREAGLRWRAERRAAQAVQP
jgi:hypothetical protein